MAIRLSIMRISLSISLTCRWLLPVSTSWVLLVPTMAQRSVGYQSQFGLGIQQYPTGFLFTVMGVYAMNEQTDFEVRIGYNLVRHGSAGVHEDERGGGWGGSLAIFKRAIARYPRLSLGLRTDLWFNQIDWKDDIQSANPQFGHTDAIVFQPTLVGHYVIELGDHFTLVPSLALGAEINLRERGGEVGEGPILLWGFQFFRSFETDY